MKPVICVIGAGSQSFGLSTLSTLLNTPELRGSEIRLVDIRATELELIAKLGERLNREWGAGCEIRHSTDRREMLPGSDFVVISVAIDRWERWKSDYEVGLKHNITHYAENGGPGSFAHTTRNLRIILPILQDVAELAPDCYLLNFTNPVPRITLAARRAGLKAYGICHQIYHGYMMAGYLLRDALDVDAPDSFDDIRDPETKKMLRACMDVAVKKIDIKAAGLNHFTWILSITQNGTGRDLYPLLKERLRDSFEKFEPLTRRVANAFGVIPVSGDTHLSEYLPYSHSQSRDSWKRNHMGMFQFDRAIKFGDESWKKIRRMVEGTEGVDELRRSTSERVEAVIAAIVRNENAYELALNMPNRGHIKNLPDEAIIEVPAIVNAAGIHGLAMGALPDTVAELCRREIAVARLFVEAAEAGSRKKAIEGMALCPMVDDLDLAVSLVDDYIAANKGYFPDFH